MGEVSGCLECKHESTIPPGEGDAAPAERARARAGGRGAAGPLRDAAGKSGSETARRTAVYKAISPQTSQADVPG